MNVGNQHFGPVGAKGDGGMTIEESVKDGDQFKPKEMDMGLIDVVLGPKPTLQQGQQYQVGVHNREGN